MRYQFMRLSIILFVVMASYYLNIPAAVRADSSQDVLLGRVNNNRTGAYINETTLTPTNVNINQFGKLYARPVIGDIYAQPLYVTGLNIPGKGMHNVVFAATAHNMVYAFDADDTTAAGNTPLWSVDFGSSSDVGLPPLTSTGPGGGLCTCDVWDGELGVLGTPVIDSATQTMYVVSEHGVGTTQAAHYLHALDITTGTEKFNGPVLITATVAGTGQGSTNGQLVLNSYQELQRPALTLLNGSVYIAFGGTNDRPPFHGWVIGYNASNISQQTGAFVDTPNGGGGGIWSDFAMASDGTYLYVSTGNGTFDVSSTSTGPDYGDSVLKLDPSGNQLKLADWYVASNEAWLDNQDLDLGTTGPVIVPGTNYLLSGGKQGWLTTLKRNSLGHYVGQIPPSLSVTQPNPTTDTNVVQEFDTYSGEASHMHSSPIFWNSPNGPVVYTWTEQDYAKAYNFSTTASSPFNTIPFSLSQSPVVGTGMPPGILSLSANGSQNGILWASVNLNGYGNRSGVLYALDASDLTKVFWSSQMNSTRDAVGTIAKFSPPVIANGKVFVGSFALASQTGGTNPASTAYLNAYGLLSTGTPTPTQTTTPATPTLTPTASLTVTPGGTSLYAQTVMADGPVSYWRLGEKSGSIAADSADGNTGTITGGVTLGTTGAIANDANTAMTFDGSSGYINIPYKANLDIQNDLTLEAWAKPTLLNGNPTSVAEKGFYNYRIGTLGNKWRGSIFFQGVTYDVVAPTTATIGQWAYIVMVRKGTTLTLYVNGVAVTSIPTQSGSIDIGSNPMTIGRKSSALSDYFNGPIDEVAVYNKALTAMQVMAHYNAGNQGTIPTFTPTSIPPKATPTSTGSPTPTATPNTLNYAQTVMGDGPVSYWRLGETSGSIAVDSADGNTGTITGNVTLGTAGAIANDANTAMTFDGSSGYINIPYNTNLDIQNDLTLEAWAKPNVLNGNPTSVAEKGFYNYRIGTVDNKWRGSIFFQGVTYDVVAPTTATVGQWAYIVMVRKSTTLTLYVNGVAVTSIPTQSGPIDIGSNPMTIGRKSSALSDYFNGPIDEIAVYNKALTAAQIMGHFNAGSRGTIPTFTPTSIPPTATPSSTVNATSTPTITLTATRTSTLAATFQPPTNTPNSTGTTTGTLTYTQTVMADGPVSYWRLGENSGTIAADSADGNTGTITGGVTLRTAGAIVNDSNTAMTFDGSSGDINIPYKANLDIQNDLTLEAWAKPTMLNGNPASVAEKGFYNYRIGTVSNKWRGSIFFKGVTYDVVAPTAATAGQWAYIVMVRKGTTLTLYVNGVAVTSITTQSGSIDIGSNPMTIGRKSSALSDFFNGSIDEVAVYNKALTAAQVTAHYNAGSGQH